VTPDVFKSAIQICRVKAAEKKIDINVIREEQLTFRFDPSLLRWTSLIYYISKVYNPKFLRSNILSIISGVSGRNYPATRRFMERNQHFMEHGLPCGLGHVHLTFSGGCTIAQVEST
jgi:hypothetical protein